MEVAGEKPGRKIAIIGKAPSTMLAAPYDDESWEIWTLYDTPQRNEVPRWSRNFELHPLSGFEDNKEYYQWLSTKHEQPIYLRKEHEDVPSGVAYPVDEIVERFGRYFTNTVSWMIALAIHEEVSEIGLWGVDMAHDTEYGTQRPSCEYFVGMAVGSGITVQIPEASDLLKTRVLYGFETDSSQMREKLRVKRLEVAAQMKAQQDKRNQAALNAAFCEGADEILQYCQQWM